MILFAVFTGKREEEKAVNAKQRRASCGTRVRKVDTCLGGAIQGRVRSECGFVTRLRST
jgi:hypothetical protein